MCVCVSNEHLWRPDALNLYLGHRSHHLVFPLIHERLWMNTIFILLFKKSCDSTKALSYVLNVECNHRLLFYIELIKLLHSGESSTFFPQTFGNSSTLSSMFGSLIVERRHWLNAYFASDYDGCISSLHICNLYRSNLLSSVRFNSCTVLQLWVSNFIGNNVKLFAIAMEMSASIRINC